MGKRRGPGGLSDDPVKAERQLAALRETSERMRAEREELAADPRPMRFCYADPPYPGESRRHYEWHDDYDGEVDHKALIEQLCDEYPDGWALSTKESALGLLLPMCPHGHRIGAWIKPMTPFKPWPDVQYGWEPVIWMGGRRRSRKAMIVNNFVVANPVNWKSMPNGVPGMKPREFSYWLFDVWNARDGDELVDLFPGSGAVSDAWDGYVRQQRLMYHGAPANEALEGFPT